jgi:hypothetical protein
MKFKIGDVIVSSFSRRATIIDFDKEYYQVREEYRPFPAYWQSIRATDRTYTLDEEYVIDMVLNKYQCKKTLD